MQIRLEWTYFIPRAKQGYHMKSEYMSAEECLYLINDIEKSGRLKGDISFFDQNDSSWKKKDIVRYTKRFETEPHSAVAYIDGSYNQTSKEAGIGIVIYYKQHQKQWRLRVNGQMDLLEDSNEAEYAALFRLLQEIETLGIKEQTMTVYLDSLLVCNQVIGEWACYEKSYLNWLDKIDHLTQELKLTIHYEQIERHLNKEADQLAAQALKGILIESKIERV